MKEKDEKESKAQRSGKHVQGQEGQSLDKHEACKENKDNVIIKQNEQIIILLRDMLAYLKSIDKNTFSGY